MSEELNWGIIGTGRIARKFAAAVEESATARLAAVGQPQAGNGGSFSAGNSTCPTGMAITRR